MSTQKQSANFTNSTNSPISEIREISGCSQKTIGEIREISGPAPMNPEFLPQMSFPPEVQSHAPSAEHGTSAQKQSTNCTNSTNSSISEIREISGPAPKISVIVPVYKVEKYLPECIESVLAQTFTDFELILVDDGSPDNSGAICDAYAARDPRVRVFHKENGGVSSARNLGLDHARGEWIAFVDSDDTVTTDFLQSIAECVAYRKESLPSAIFYAFSTCKKDLNNNNPASIYSSSECGFHQFLFYLWKRDLFGYTWCKAFQRKIIVQNNLRFREDFSLCEDLIFTLDYLCAVQEKELILIDKKLYFYRQPENPRNAIRHNDSFSAQEKITTQVKNLLLKLKEEKNPAQNSCLDKIIFARAHRALIAGLISDYREKGRFPKFNNISQTLVWKEIMHAKLKNVLAVLNTKWATLFLLRVLPGQFFFQILSLKIYHSIKTQ